MSYIDLTVDQDQLVVDLSVGQTSARTFINYKAQFATVDVQLQQRVGTTSSWSTISLATVMLNAAGNLPKDYKQVGRFATPFLKPGDVYQVRALIEGNSSDVQGLQTVLVLTQGPSQKGLLADWGLHAGGTYVSTAAHAIQPTVWVAEIGQGQPGKLPNGLLAFAQPNARVVDPNLATNHDAELKGGLLAGNDYTVLMRLSDQFGNWEERTFPVTLLQRKVTIAVTTIHVDDDGDDLNSGEASFNLDVWEGVAPLDEQVANRVTGWGFYNNSVDTGQDLSMPPGGQPPYKVTIGPKKLTGADYSIGLRAYGTEYDPWPQTDEHAANDLIDASWLDVPEGIARERVVNGSIFVKAGPLSNGDSFAFTAKGTYDIDYV